MMFLWRSLLDAALMFLWQKLVDAAIRWVHRHCVIHLPPGDYQTAAPIVLGGGARI